MRNIYNHKKSVMDNIRYMTIFERSEYQMKKFTDLCANRDFKIAKEILKQVIQSADMYTHQFMELAYNLLNDNPQYCQLAQKLADDGNGIACCCLGIYYRNTQQINEAFYYMKKGVSVGYGQCMVNLGMLYLYRIVPMNIDKANELFQRAIEYNDCMYAHLNLGYMMELKGEYENAARHYMLENNSVISTFLLGRLYEYGRGVEKDEKKAIIYYKKSYTILRDLYSHKSKIVTKNTEQSPLTYNVFTHFTCDSN